MKENVGKRIRVTSGVFKGHEGKIRAVDGPRIYIDFDENLKEFRLDLNVISFYKGEIEIL